jgi:TetR/AcrR family transcriptional repressor of nem operon
MGRPKSYNRADVLERATRVFWSKGFEGTHLSELVKATGLNRFSLYNEFGGKDGLYRAALDHYIEGLGGLLSILDREPPGLANIRAFYRAELGQNFQDGCFALNTIREKNIVPPAAWGTVQGFMQSVGERLQRNMRAAAKSGELPPTADPDVLAETFGVFGMGLLSSRSAGAKPAELLRIIEEMERLLE